MAAPSYGSFQNYSGMIVQGGVAQQLAPVAGRRRYFLCQNRSNDNLYIDFGMGATEDMSFMIVPGWALELNFRSGATDFISIMGPTTGQKFVAKTL